MDQETGSQVPQCRHELLAMNTSRSVSGEQGQCQCRRMSISPTWTSKHSVGLVPRKCRKTRNAAEQMVLPTRYHACVPANGLKDRNLAVRCQARVSSTG